MSTEVGSSSDLPFIDAHTVVLPVAQGDAWDRLQEAVARSWLLGGRGFPSRHADVPRALRLAGSHLFAAYELCFDLDEAMERSAEAPRGVPCTSVRAATYARFKPGLGGVYRALVISSGVHAVLMRRFLKGLRCGSSRRLFVGRITRSVNGTADGACDDRAGEHRA